MLGAVKHAIIVVADIDIVIDIGIDIVVAVVALVAAERARPGPEKPPPRNRTVGEVAAAFCYVTRAWRFSVCFFFY